MIFHQPGNSRGNFNYNSWNYRGKEYAPHFHKNMELICVLSGAVPVTVNGVTKVLQKGQWALVLSNQIHSFRVDDSSELWVMVFSEEYVPAFAGQIQGKQGTDYVFFLSEPVETMVKSKMLHSDCSRMMRKACLYAVCDEFLAQTPLEARQERSTFLVGQLLDWISANYTQDVTLKQAATIFGYEYHYLSRLLNRNFAISFTDLLMGYRVEHALRLLQETDLPITQIAERSGFQSIRSFNLSFKKYTGETPANYRKHN